MKASHFTIHNKTSERAFEHIVQDVRMSVFGRMRAAMIIRRIATGTRAGPTPSFYSNRIPSSRTFALVHWRCFHGCGRGTTNCPPTISLQTSGCLSRIRTTPLKSTGFTGYRRYFGSTSILEDQGMQSKSSGIGGKKPEQNAKSLAISINKRIVELGKDGHWRQILNLYEKQKNDFNAVNYSTAMSQLARIRQAQKDDPLFEEFLADLSSKLNKNGIIWAGDVRQLSTVVHAVAKMRLQPKHNASANGIMAFMVESEIVDWIFENGKPQEIANCVWACGALGIEAPALFNLLDQKADWFVDNATPQGVANCLWACGTLGIEAPNLFRSLDKKI
ncbi:hypothetical protein MHU86_22977 [Fragilaria crotonensis]|nr:hypothetical protein MHU86_22977 [Fragilaria crotonensis]